MNKVTAADALDNIRSGLPGAQSAFIRIVQLVDDSTRAEDFAILAGFLAVVETETSNGDTEGSSNA